MINHLFYYLKYKTNIYIIKDINKYGSYHGFYIRNMNLHW